VRKSRYSDEQIAATVHRAEAGAPVDEILSELGISEATFHVWKKRFQVLRSPETRELRQLRDENAQLKRLVADLAAERHVCPSCSQPDGAPASADEGDSVSRALGSCAREHLNKALIAAALDAASEGLRVDVLATDIVLTSLAVPRGTPLSDRQEQHSLTPTPMATPC
jgi:putative transposase